MIVLFRITSSLDNVVYSTREKNRDEKETEEEEERISSVGELQSIGTDTIDRTLDLRRCRADLAKIRHDVELVQNHFVLNES